VTGLFRVLVCAAGGGEGGGGVGGVWRRGVMEVQSVGGGGVGSVGGGEVGVLGGWECIWVGGVAGVGVGCVGGKGNVLILLKNQIDSSQEGASWKKKGRVTRLHN